MRTGLQSLSWPALLAALLVACGGGGSGSAPDPDPGTPVLKPSQPGDLTTYVQRVLRERAAQRQAGNAVNDASRTVVALPVGAAAPAPGTAPAFSTSLTQERDVDEPDLLKTDGVHLFSLDLQDSGKPLLRTTRRLASGALEERGAAPLAFGGATALAPRGLVLSADSNALAAASEGWAGVVGNPCVDICPPTILLPGPVWMRNLVAVERFDVADPARPSASTRLEFDGRLVDARRVGNHLVLVSEYQPLLAADQLPASASTGEREAAIAATRGTDLLPLRRLASGGTQALMSETDCWVQPANASLALSVTTITVVDLRVTDLAPVSRCFIGGTEAIYMTTQAIYVASTRWAYTTAGGGVGLPILRYPATMHTDIHKFGFDGATGQLAYRASGEVVGHLGWDPERKSYRLGEHEGLLRVLSFTGTTGWFTAADAAGTPPSPATLTVLREVTGTAGTSGGRLEALATLPNARRPEPLGKAGEQLHGVRFAGTRGYAVTFRQVDPLYVLDLADPADPRIAGVLEVSGFSDHLVPLSERLLLGVGKEVNAATGRVGGVKVSLFDVADATRPRELATQVFGSTGSQSGLDQSRHGLTMLQQGSTMRLSTPLYLVDANYANPRDRLQRLEVDLNAGTLAAKPAIVPPTSPAPSPGQIAQQRSVLIGEQVYWLHGGRLGGFAW
ncbi:MAG: beta-propeller domain-containing protein [Burkholderiales bacterium]|nr:beta-propeller domain-containing protein [Burkholderiales bacterium]